MNNNRKGLGRGLGALLSIFEEEEEELVTPAPAQPKAETPAPKPAPAPAPAKQEDFDDILPNPFDDVPPAPKAEVKPAEPPRPATSAFTPSPAPAPQFDGESPMPQFVNGLSEVGLDRLEVNPNQPRKHFDEVALNELAESIKIHGIIQPIVINEIEHGKYMIIAGERRFRAARIAGLKTVPCVLKDYTDRQVKEISLIENLQREDLNPIEAARAIRQLMEEYNFTQEVVAERIGKSRPTVTNLLRLLNLTPEVRAYVEDGTLSAGHARPMIVILDPALQLKVANTVIEKQLSARETERLVREVLRPQKDAPERVLEQSTELINFGQELERVFSTKVSIHGDDHRGRISINYFSKDDLDRIFELVELLKTKQLTLKDLSNFNKRS